MDPTTRHDAYDLALDTTTSELSHHDTSRDTSQWQNAILEQTPSGISEEVTVPAAERHGTDAWLGGRRGSDAV